MCPPVRTGGTLRTRKFTAEQIAFAIKQAELGTSISVGEERVGQSRMAELLDLDRSKRRCV